MQIVENSNFKFIKWYIFATLFLFIVLIGINKASATTYTVCSSGCNQTTIQAVFTNTNLEPGDIVEIQADTPGGSKTYAEAVAFGTDDVGDATANVTLQGRAGDTITIDGENTITNCLTAVSKSYITINNLIVANCTVRNIRMSGTADVSDNGIVLSNITSSGGAIGIYLENKSNSTFSNITVTGASGTAGFTITRNGAGFYSNNVTLSNITSTSSARGIEITGVNNLMVTGDLNAYTVVNYGVAFIDITGDLTQSEGTTITVRNVQNSGFFLNSSTADMAFDGTIDTASTTQRGVRIFGSALSAGSYIDTILADDNDSNGVELDTVSDLTVNKITTSNNSSHGISLDGSSDITINQAISSGNTQSGISVTDSTGITLNSSNGQSELYDNTYDGLTLNTNASVTVENYIIRNTGGGDGVPESEGDALTAHTGSQLTARHNVIYDNDNTCFGMAVDSSIIAYHNTCYSNGVEGGPRSGNYMLNTSGSVIVKNNVFSENLPMEVAFDDAADPSVLTEDYNLFYHPSGDNFSKVSGVSQATFTGWQSASSDDANSVEGDPKFIAPGSANFQLNWTSPAIDIGTNVGLLTDFSGNSIYGLPDAGAYEYQPPYTFASNDIPTTGSIRLYSDGKYRITSASTTAAVADFSVMPSEGAYHATTTQYMDISIDTWQTTGSKNKQWTATSTAGDFLSLATSTLYAVGDLAASRYYQFKLDGENSTDTITGETCTEGLCQADDSGNLTFTYTGGYSTHTFALEQDTNAPTGATISSITPDSVSQLTITSVTAADSGSGLDDSPYWFTETSGNTGGSSSSEWQSSINFVDTGLSENTQYTYKVKARDKNTNESESSESVSKYTLADTPTNLASSLNSNDVTLTVDSFPNATSGESGYYFSSTSGANSGWIETNSWTDSGLACKTTYTYTVKYRNGDGVETGSISVNQETNQCSSGGGASFLAYSGNQLPYSPNQPQQISFTPSNTIPQFTTDNPNGNLPESREIINTNPQALADSLGQVRNQNLEEKVISEAISRSTDVASFTHEQKRSLSNFVVYGTPETQFLGSGERAGSIYSFQSAFKKMPKTEEDWSDVLKISMGRWPTQTSPEREKEVVTYFEKVYLRPPGDNIPTDQVAIDVMAYGLRPKNRNLHSEEVAIGYFNDIFGHLPESASDWDVVRAIAYSGASR